MPKSKRKSPKTPRYVDAGFLKALGEHFKRLRKKQGYSMDRIAKESEKLSPSVIHRLEKGIKPVSILSLFRVAEVLNIKISDLLDFETSIKSEAPKIYAPDDPLVKKNAYKSWLPLYSIKAAAGYFGQGVETASLGWVEAKSSQKLDSQMFVIQIKGQSMEPDIKDGSYAIFRSNPAGTRQGKIVLAQYHGPSDPETGGSYTVKKYHSTKTLSKEGSWQHREIILSPINSDFEPIRIQAHNANDFKIIAEFISTL